MRRSFGRWLGLAVALAVAGATGEGDATAQAHIALARYFAENHLPETAALRQIVMQGAASLLDAPDIALPV